MSCANGPYSIAKEIDRSGGAGAWGGEREGKGSGEESWARREAI